MPLKSGRSVLARYILAMFAVLLLSSLPVYASLIVSVGNASANAGSTGNALDVQLQNTGASAVTIGGFSFGINSASSDITFTEANTSPANYIFAGNSLFGPIINTSSGQSLLASDVDIDFAGASVGAGTSVSLGQVLFDVAGSANTQLYTITLSGFPATSLSDTLGNDITIDQFQSGSISVTGSTTVVPEPGTLSLAMLGLSGVAGAIRRRIRI